MSTPKTILDTLIAFMIGLFNGFLVMILLGWVASYVVLFNVWLVTTFSSNHDYILWIFYFIDIISQIFSLFIILSLTKFLYYKTLKDFSRRTILFSTLGLLVFPIIVYIFPLIYISIKSNHYTYQLILDLLFILFSIFINSYILKQFFK